MKCYEFIFIVCPSRGLQKYVQAKVLLSYIKLF